MITARISLMSVDFVTSIVRVVGRLLGWVEVGLIAPVPDAAASL